MIKSGMEINPPGFVFSRLGIPGIHPLGFITAPTQHFWGAKRRIWGKKKKYKGKRGAGRGRKNSLRVSPGKKNLEKKPGTGGVFPTLIRSNSSVLLKSLISLSPAEDQRLLFSRGRAGGMREKGGKNMEKGKFWALGVFFQGVHVG